LPEKDERLCIRAGGAQELRNPFCRKLAWRNAFPTRIAQSEVRDVRIVERAQDGSAMFTRAAAPDDLQKLDRLFPLFPLFLA